MKDNNEELYLELIEEVNRENHKLPDELKKSISDKFTKWIKDKED